MANEKLIDREVVKLNKAFDSVCGVVEENLEKDKLNIKVYLNNKLGKVTCELKHGRVSEVTLKFPEE